VAQCPDLKFGNQKTTKEGKDIFFPLDGAIAVYNRVRQHYKALGAEG
jgi:hypothetical protein